jgi:hypothetical protein
VAGYTAKKFMEKLKRAGAGPCCEGHLFGELDVGDPDHAYISELTRGGLKVPSSSLLSHVSTCFAALAATYQEIRVSKLKEAQAAAVVLSSLGLGAAGGASPPFSCGAHGEASRRDVMRRIINVFFNNHRKIATGSLPHEADTVVGF